ncbi:restriction endonuclease subunit S [Helicobacter pylori]
MIGPLSSQLNAIKWGEFKLGDLFEIEKTLSFNKDALTQGQDYDYITRTSELRKIKAFCKPQDLSMQKI